MSQSLPPAPPPPPPPGVVGAYWAAMEEDHSVPTSDEYEEIIQSAAGGRSALDHEHWERSFFPEFDDLDYRPVEKARLTWKFSGVRGDKDRPNRARIMRSPPAYVGGYWWTIKFFPRGNAVSDLSLYVECSPTLPAPDKHLPNTEFTVQRGPPDAAITNCTPDMQIKFCETDDSLHSWLDCFKGRYSNVSEESLQTPKNEDGPTNRQWRVPAQVAVVMYNPGEPHTFSADSASHQFNSHSTDWGWTNFHGPWDQIHLRQHGQRQAMLRNDTLAFDVYIRVVHDPTLLLWWHASDLEPSWDCRRLTGYCPIEDSCVYDNSPQVAGLAAWVHLAPFRDIIQEVNVLEHLINMNARPKPICRALQEVFWKAMMADEDDSQYIDTERISSHLQHLLEFSDDVVEFWERLRRALDYELAGTEHAERLSKLFDSPPLLPESAGSDTQSTAMNTLPTEYNSCIRLHAADGESVRNLLEKYLNAKHGRWSLPPILNVELCRRTFDKATRQWRLLYNRVNLDEELDLTSQVMDGQCGEYVLYGYVVHRGKRTSGKFYSILRPGGPGTKWLAFDDADEISVRYLTRKMALATHSGLDDSQLNNVDERSGHDVAATVLYVRADVVHEFLPGLQTSSDAPSEIKSRFKKPFVPHPEESSGEKNNKDLQVEVYYLQQYDELPGYSDAYDLLSLAHSVGGVMRLTVPSSIPFVELRKEIARRVSDGSEQQIHADRIHLWTIQHFYPHGAPFLLNRLSNLNDSLGARPNNVRLWMQVVSEADSKYFAVPDPPPQATVPDNKSEGAVTEREDVQVPGDIRPEDGEADIIHEWSGGDVVDVGSISDSSDAASGQRQPRENTNDQTRGQPPLIPETAPSQEESAVPSHLEQPSLELPPVRHAYYFIQIFDVDEQTLRTVGSFFSDANENIRTGIRKNLNWPEDKEFLVWERLPMKNCFSAEISGDTFRPCDGAYFVVGDTLSKEKLAQLAASGLLSEPEALVRYLLAKHRGHPTKAFTGTRTAESSFGDDYYDGQFVKGYYHGHGTHISSSGSVYVGDFVMGQRHGKGRIEYGSGDVYDGDWVDDNPHGQGIFIEKRTGNKYIGGYAKGKRHGKGVTYWEVADEETDMCHICYGEGQDALFYDCGHLCACMDCAQQVDVCPICRRDIINVVRVYKI